MKVVVVTGSAGLIGSEAVAFLADKFDVVVGIDNNTRQKLFGEDASVLWNRNRLISTYSNYQHYDVDIQNKEALEAIFNLYNTDIALIIHAAAQPSHDWAAKDPFTDFGINAYGTLNMLELCRKYSEKAVFIFTSTNKLYGDTPNRLPLLELESRWEIAETHPYFKHGIDENMSIDQTKHSLFGVSKLAADVLVQEYGRYFGMYTGVFRGGCLTGPLHSGTQLHGFLSYLMKCAVTKEPYTVFGYKGKQVRDNIHSYDLINMFWHFYQNPKQGEVYNAGGGRFSNCSMQEAILLCEEITGNKMNYSYSATNRNGDHVWWISDVSKFRKHYPEWTWNYNIKDILEQIHRNMSNRVASTVV